MDIRKASEKDIDKILNLLEQVLEVHAKIRPDIFVSGTTKYTYNELKEIINNEKSPVYVATDSEDNVLGYVFCIIQDPIESNNMVPFRSIYIDDLCVDENKRGLNIGKALFEFIKLEAKRLGCYEITLNVWEGNENAMKFYKKMGLKPKKTVLEFIL